MPIPWSGRATKTVSAAALGALLLTSAMKHFREPAFFHRRHAYSPAGTPAQRKAPTVRLPLQVPVVFWAWSLRKPGLRR